MDLLHKKAADLFYFKKAYCLRQTKVSSADHENYEHPPFMNDSRRPHTGPSTNDVGGIRSSVSTAHPIDSTTTSTTMLSSNSNNRLLIGLGILAIAALIIFRNY